MNKILFGIMTILFNGIGVPCFMQGKVKTGVSRIILACLPFIGWIFSLINYIKGIILGIRILKMDEQTFRAEWKTLDSGIPAQNLKRLNDLEYLKMSKFRAFWYNVGMFFCAIPGWIADLFIKLFMLCKNVVLAIVEEIKAIVTTFVKGNWAVKLSHFIFGFGNFYYGQPLRGALFLLFEVVFGVYMFVPSGARHWLGAFIKNTSLLAKSGLEWLIKSNFLQTGQTVGNVPPRKEIIQGLLGATETTIYGDDSVKVMLYALLSIFFIIAFIYTWWLQIKQCRICMSITAKGKKVRSGKQDLKSLLDDQFHKTLLSLPLVGICAFTVLPIIYMVLIAFTSYDAAHDGYANLFSWVGLHNFNQLFNFGKGGLGLAFGEILAWTLMWSFFATFSNYFLGMFVAIMINKKGIKIKKFWRTVLVMTIAIPQFVSLLYVSRLFDDSGVLGKLLINASNVLANWNVIPDTWALANNFSLWDGEWSAKILLIVLNIWIGIPYLMLMATGILMNIPADLYESSRIDGANTFQQYTKITLPYMLFVTGPYLLTSFVGNLNNFNVIYLLSGGGPNNGTAGGVSVGHTDLLVTWLYRMTLESPKAEYYTASIIGIMVFLVVAILSLIVYNIIPSTKNEEDYK